MSKRDDPHGPVVLPDACSAMYDGFRDKLRSIPARPPVGDTTADEKCAHCGEELAEVDTPYCSCCGKPLPVGDTTQPQPTDEPPDSVCDVCHGAKRIYWAGDSTECSTCEGTGSIPSGQKRFRVWMTREESARIDAVFGAVAEIRALLATWAVDDDTYLHLDGPDLGYADAAVQIAAILDKAGCP